MIAKLLMKNKLWNTNATAQPPHSSCSFILSFIPRTIWKSTITLLEFINITDNMSTIKLQAHLNKLELAFVMYTCTHTISN